MSHLDISPKIVQQSLAKFFRVLEDYTVNERGDVGSWVRVACIKGLCNIIQALLFDAEFLTTKDMHVSISDYLSVEDYHKAIAGILKQGVERLDNVRQCAGEAVRDRRIHVLLPPISSPAHQHAPQMTSGAPPRFVFLQQSQVGLSRRRPTLFELYEDESTV